MAEHPTGTTAEIPSVFSGKIALLLGAACTGALAFAAQQTPWLEKMSLPRGIQDLIHQIPTPTMFVVVGLLFTMLFTLIGDGLHLRRLVKGIRRFQKDPSTRDNWGHNAYLASLAPLGERCTQADIRAGLVHHQEKCTSRLAVGWFFKYYVVAFALPAVVLFLGLWNLRIEDGRIPYSDLFRPLILVSILLVVMLGIALLISRGTRLALEDWKDKAIEFARAGERAGPYDPALAQAPIGPASPAPRDPYPQVATPPQPPTAVIPPEPPMPPAAIPPEPPMAPAVSFEPAPVPPTPPLGNPAPQLDDDAWDESDDWWDKPVEDDSPEDGYPAHPESQY